MHEEERPSIVNKLGDSLLGSVFARNLNSDPQSNIECPSDEYRCTRIALIISRERIVILNVGGGCIRILKPEETKTYCCGSFMIIIGFLII